MDGLFSGARVNTRSDGSKTQTKSFVSCYKYFHNTNCYLGFSDFFAQHHYCYTVKWRVTYCSFLLYQWRAALTSPPAADDFYLIYSNQRRIRHEKENDRMKFLFSLESVENKVDTQFRAATSPELTATLCSWAEREIMSLSLKLILNYSFNISSTQLILLRQCAVVSEGRL